MLSHNLEPRRMEKIRNNLEQDIRGSGCSGVGRFIQYICWDLLCNFCVDMILHIAGGDLT